MGATTADLTDQLRSWFGFADFRPGQREACEATLAGRDVLAIMPTGSGKSLCYQLPALIDGQLTLVVSPLIALMQDQYAALRARGLDGVEMIASSMSSQAVAETLARVRGGEVRLLYVAPERFSSRRFLEAIEAAGVRRLAIDEAHCLSEWGHDFRPDYLRLADVRTRLGSPPTIALTATATRRVAGDIVRALELRDPVSPRTGFDRPNLFFAVERVGSDAAKPAVLLELLQARRARCRRSSTAAGGRRARRCRRTCSVRASRPRRTTPGWRRASARRRWRASWPAGSTWSPPPPRSAWASTRRTFARSCTGRSRRRPRSTTSRPAAPAATGCRPAAPCSTADGTRA